MNSIYPMMDDYPRDMVGYGETPPDPQWPGGARLAVQFVLNYEEGGENCILHGDPASEAYLTEIVGLDLSRFCAAPSARLSHFPFESDRAFPAQC